MKSNLNQAPASLDAVKVLASMDAVKVVKIADNEAKEAINTEYKDKEKIKPLTTTERLDRIEQLLKLK